LVSTLLFVVWVVAMLPAMLIELFSGYVYQEDVWIAMIICVIGKALGIALIYFLSQRYLKKGNILKSKFLIGLNRAIRKDQNRFIFLIRMSVLPFFVKNYGLSVLDTDFKPFILISCAISLPFTAWHVFLGAESAKVAEHSGSGALVILIIAIIASILLFGYLIILTRKITKEIEEYSNEDSDKANPMEVKLINKGEKNFI